MVSYGGIGIPKRKKKQHGKLSMPLTVLISYFSVARDQKQLNEERFSWVIVPEGESMMAGEAEQQTALALR